MYSIAKFIYLYIYIGIYLYLYIFFFACNESNSDQSGDGGNSVSLNSNASIQLQEECIPCNNPTDSCPSDECNKTCGENTARTEEISRDELNLRITTPEVLIEDAENDFIKNKDDRKNRIQTFQDIYTFFDQVHNIHLIFIIQCIISKCLIWVH